MQLRMQGSRALVTGGTGGIGAAIAEALVAEKIGVVIADTRAPADAARFVTMDVRDAAAVHRGFDTAQEMLGGEIDILVNAAGLYPCDPILEMSEEAWDRVLDVNVKGMFLTSQDFGRRRVDAHRPGCIVNITSGAAERARVGAAHYCTSKAAAEMLTRAFALEFAEYGIRVNAVSPGYVEVNSEVNPLNAEYKTAITRSIPLGRSGAPRDIAQTVLFLCSEAAEWITGSSYRVDGGSRAGTLGLPLSRVRP